jgi:hypothetical protein
MIFGMPTSAFLAMLAKGDPQTGSPFLLWLTRACFAGAKYSQDMHYASANLNDGAKRCDFG